MALQLATIALPADMEWPDEFTWSPVAQQVDIASDGALIVEASAQLAGRPVTLQSRQDGNIGFAWVNRATVTALYDLAATPSNDPMTLLLHDGRSFNVLFRYADGAPVEAHPLQHLAPHVDADQYLLILRLMQV